MKFSNHFEREAAFTVENLGHTMTGSDIRFQISALQALLLHPKEYGFHRICGVHRKVILLIDVDQRGKYVQFIAIVRTRFR